MAIRKEDIFVWTRQQLKWNMLVSHRTDLPLLAQNHFDGIGGNHDLDLLFLYVLQFELVLCAEQKSHVNKSRRKKKSNFTPG